MQKLLGLSCAVLLGLGPAMAQDTPDKANGRYALSPTTGGQLRLDTATGQVSFCSTGAAGWACNVVPDERQALDAEIGRLQADNAALKKELLGRGLPLPGGVKPDRSDARADLVIKLPSDAEIDRALTVFEKVWRRMVGIVQSTPPSR